MTLTSDDILIFAVEQYILGPGAQLLPFPCGCLCQPEYFFWDDGPSFGIKAFIRHENCMRTYHTFERMKHITIPLTANFVHRSKELQAGFEFRKGFFGHAG